MCNFTVFVELTFKIVYSTLKSALIFPCSLHPRVAQHVLNSVYMFCMLHLLGFFKSKTAQTCVQTFKYFLLLVSLFYVPINSIPKHEPLEGTYIAFYIT